MERKVSEDDFHALSVGPIMFGQELRVGLHVVVQKQENLASSQLGAAVSRRRCATVGLFDNGELERRSEFPKRFGRPVFGAINDYDHFEAGFEALGGQRTDQRLHQFPPLVRRNNDAEAGGVHGAAK